MFSKNVIVAAVFALSLTSSIPALSQAPPAPAAAEAKPAPGVLHRADLEALIPPSVFFKGQSATVQLRNSGGVRFADGGVMFAVKVDTSGYSTSVQERYQDYLVTEVPLRFAKAQPRRRWRPGPTVSVSPPRTASWLWTWALTRSSVSPCLQTPPCAGPRRSRSSRTMQASGSTAPHLHLVLRGPSRELMRAVALPPGRATAAPEQHENAIIPDKFTGD